MMKIKINFAGIIFSCLAGVVMLAALSGCSRTSASKGGDPLAADTETKAATNLDPAQTGPEDPLAAALNDCEHKIPTYQCAECRYEAGVVKADGSLWKDSTGGLFKDMSVQESELQSITALTGEIRLNENAAVHISARATGVIESVSVDIGQTVKAGTELFTINSTEFGQALRDYEKSKALTTLSEKNYLREKSLVAKRVSPEQDLIQAQMVWEQNRAELRAAEQSLHVMGLTEQEMAALNNEDRGPMMNRLATRAPLSGTVIEKHVVNGELVAPGKEVMLIANLSSVWVWANVHEKDLAALIEQRKQGPIPVSITVPSFPGVDYAGKIDYIGATVDEPTRTVKVRAKVANPGSILRPGMFCQVRAPFGTAVKAVTVPRTAVFSDEGQSFVFVHWKEDYYLRRPIVTGQVQSKLVEVVKGLKSGERIVAYGAFLMKSDVLRSKMGAGCAD